MFEDQLHNTKHKVRMSILLLILLWSCSEVIDLDTETQDGQLVIYGRLTNGQQGNKIELSRATLVGLPPRPISGARVQVFDGQGNAGSYRDEGEGNYRYNGAFTGEPGEAYHLRIELGDGNVYESVPEVMPELGAKDSLYYVLEEIEEGSTQGVTTTRFVVSIYADTEISDSRSDLFLKWNVEEVFSFEQAFLPQHNFPWYFRHTCYMTEELEEQRVDLYDGSELRASGINAKLVTNRSIDDDFRGVHYFNYIQQNITAGAHAFWSGLDQNVNRVGSIFDQPPGALSTNLFNVNDASEEVIGYFEVMSVDTARLKITNRIIDRFFSIPCVSPPEVDFAPFMCFPCIERYFEPECLNCLVLANSSHTRPSYFD